MDYKDLREVDLKIVDLTTDPDHPAFSVRMPTAQFVETHDTYYIELLCYISVPGSKTYEMNVSPVIASNITHQANHRAKRRANSSPRNWASMMDLTTIENLGIIAEKFRRFQESGGFDQLFAKYGK